ncbi:hypothetical protein ACFQJC_12355 [Haloferax namakaokahaiae]|uniref:Uncharacterized protein n=1 Tax=Haloferax namakaokahaiae TaxID=1748331 RepID=A0ABD5ZH75_9EURY
MVPLLSLAPATMVFGVLYAILVGHFVRQMVGEFRDSGDTLTLFSNVVVGIGGSLLFAATIFELENHDTYVFAGLVTAVFAAVLRGVALVREGYLDGISN